ncbi:hypothetical protein M441DRAFT_134122, partial [Trichoderma asperellum CBS 433.97]
NNVPQLGLSYHFVLHLTFAVTGYHLSYLRIREVQRQLYKSLAECHVSITLTELSKPLSKSDSGICGRLYVSSAPVCYCIFATGSIGPEDLLFCYSTDEKCIGCR